MKISPLLFSPILHRIVHLWSATLRYTISGFEHIRALQEEHRNFAAALWHDELFPMAYIYRGKGMVAVVSQSADGELIARLLAYFGFALARGSSSRGGVRALLSVIRQVDRAKADAVVVVDGPRGPRHVVKPGIIYLAAKLNMPIIPVRVHMHPRKVFHKAWDRFQLPMPFARVQIVIGEPMSVPERLSPSEIEQHIEILQQKLQ